MDINFITKSVTVTRGLPEQVERIQELEKENQRLREALQSIKRIPNSEAAYGIIQTFVDDALKGEE